MRLYSIQPRFVYDVLCSGRPYRPEPACASDSFLASDPATIGVAYVWLCKQMEQRGLPRPGAQNYPVWAWHQWGGRDRPRPDLRSAILRDWAKKSRHVALTIDIHDDEVLLHDYDAWHFCLNYWYLGRPRERNSFERRCKTRGLSLYERTPLDDPELHAALTESWQAIFDLDASRSALQCRPGDQVVQATFWELRPEHVRHAVEFGMGLPREVLPSPLGSPENLAGRQVEGR